MADLFLSYAAEDREDARQLASLLGEQGWSVWWDRAIRPGVWFDRAIEREIEQARGVVVLWSTHSVQSDWVRAEARSGRERKVLIPVLIEEVRIPLEFNGIQAALWPRRGRTADAHGLGPLFDAVRAILGSEGTTEGTKAPPEEGRRRKWVWPLAGTLAACVALTGLFVHLRSRVPPPAAVSQRSSPTPDSALPRAEVVPATPRPEPLAGLPGRRLFKGSKGPDVADLRAALRMLGYLDHREDGVSEELFGSETRDAVVRFQKDRGLAADGIVGPQLLAEFKSLARRSSK